MQFIPFPAKPPREIAAGILSFYFLKGLGCLFLELEFIFLVTSGLECLTNLSFRRQSRGDDGSKNTTKGPVLRAAQSRLRARLLLLDGHASLMVAVGFI